MGSSLRTTFAHIFLCLHEAVLWNLSIKFTGDMLIILFYFSKMRNKLKTVFSWCSSRALTFQKNFFISFHKSPFKMMENGFYFTLKALFVFKIFKFLCWSFDHVEKRLDLKDKVNFEIDDVRTWLTSNYNTHSAQYPTK